GADEGVAYVDPRRLGGNEVPLQVLVEAVRIDGRERAPFEVASVPAGSHTLEIDYTSTALVTAERARFRYRLEGADPGGNDVGRRRRACFPDLRPGSDRFVVNAATGDGNWVEAGAPWSYRVPPAWHQPAWFRGMVVLLIGGVGGLGVSLVQRRRRLRAQA